MGYLEVEALVNQYLYTENSISANGYQR